MEREREDDKVITRVHCSNFADKGGGTKNQYLLDKIVRKLSKIVKNCQPK